MKSSFGNDHSTVAVTDQHAGTRPVQYETRRCDVRLKGRLRLLDDIHGVAVALEDVCNGLPARTVGEGAMDNHHIPDFGVSNECQGEAQDYGKDK
jgi:hypothetical protein